MAKIINNSSFADKNAYNKTKTDFIRTFIRVKPLDKIQQTKPQESRARNFENRKALSYDNQDCFQVQNFNHRLQHFTEKCR